MLCTRAISGYQETEINESNVNRIVDGEDSDNNEEGDGESEDSERSRPKKKKKEKLNLEDAVHNLKVLPMFAALE